MEFDILYFETVLVHIIRNAVFLVKEPFIGYIIFLY